MQWRNKLIYGPLPLQLGVMALMVMVLCLLLNQMMGIKRARITQLTEATRSLVQQKEAFNKIAPKNEHSSETLVSAMDIAQEHHCVMAIRKTRALFKCPLSQQASFVKTVLQGDVALDIHRIDMKKQKQFVVIEMGLMT